MRQALWSHKFRVGNVLLDRLDKMPETHRYWKVLEVCNPKYYSSPYYVLQNLHSGVVAMPAPEHYLEHYYTKVKKTRAKTVKRLYG